MKCDSTLLAKREGGETVHFLSRRGSELLVEEVQGL